MRKSSKTSQIRARQADHEELSLESNWSRYDESEPDSLAQTASTQAVDSLGLNFSQLLSESRDLNKNVTLKTSSNEEPTRRDPSGGLDLFKVDAAKLEHALACRPFDEHLYDPRDVTSRANYFDDQVLEAFRVEAAERSLAFRSKYDKSGEAVESTPNVTIAPANETKAAKFELSAPKDESIDDWLDDLIS